MPRSALQRAEDVWLCIEKVATYERETTLCVHLNGDMYIPIRVCIPMCTVLHRYYRVTRKTDLLYFFASVAIIM